MDAQPERLTLPQACEYLARVHGVRLTVQTMRMYRDTHIGPEFPYRDSRIYTTPACLDAWVRERDRRRAKQHEANGLLLPEAVEYLARVHGVRHTVNTLRQYRNYGNGPEFRKKGQHVYTTAAALDLWVRTRTSRRKMLHPNWMNRFYALAEQVLELRAQVVKLQAQVADLRAARGKARTNGGTSEHHDRI